MSWTWDYLFVALGWLGQGFFFTRFLVQWLASERAGRIVVPKVFWQMSLGGSVCTALYAFHRDNLVFLAGPVVNFFIYARNLMLIRSGRSLGRGILIPVACGLLVLALVTWLADLHSKVDPLPWIVFGALGQLCWITRFPLQWLISEHLGRASLPPAFFWVSFVGSVLLLTYALSTLDPVFIAGMVLGPFLYGRSLYLCYRRASEPPPAPDPSPQQPAASPNPLPETTLHDPTPRPAP
jgi:lipid-A-disaccharide synthase-like uncharacterized protein